MKYPSGTLDHVQRCMIQFFGLRRTHDETVEDWVALKLSCSVEEAARMVEAVKRRQLRGVSPGGAQK